MAAGSLVVCLVLHYSLQLSQEAGFWCNILIGVFGSSLLALITATVGYRVERMRTLEDFYCQTKKLLHRLNKYQPNMSLDEKINFYLDYLDLDKFVWETSWGDISFFYDKNRDNYLYIRRTIYMPLIEVNNAIANHVWHFRLHKDGTVRNESVIENFIQEIEQLIIEKTESKQPSVDKAGNVIEWVTVTAIQNKIVASIHDELSGKYYDLMYGKRNSK